MVDFYDDLITELCREASSGALRYSSHYAEQMFSRPTPPRSQIRYMLCEDSPKVIEDYPDDKPYPSCLIYGNTFSQEPVHSVWAYNQENRWAVVITVYRPDPQRWIDWRTRRPKDDAIQ